VRLFAGTAIGVVVVLLVANGVLTELVRRRTDRYGRTLAYPNRGEGWDDSIEAPRAGVAHSYVYHNHPAARAPEIAAAEQEAKIAGRGLWGPHCFGETAALPKLGDRRSPAIPRYIAQSLRLRGRKCSKSEASACVAPRLMTACKIRTESH
jgi:hypothetical protein